MRAPIDIHLSFLSINLEPVSIGHAFNKKEIKFFSPTIVGLVRHIF